MLPVNKCKYSSYKIIIFTARENLCLSHAIQLVESAIVKKISFNLGDVTALVAAGCLIYNLFPVSWYIRK